MGPERLQFIFDSFYSNKGRAVFIGVLLRTGHDVPKDYLNYLCTSHVDSSIFSSTDNEKRLADFEEQGDYQSAFDYAKRFMPERVDVYRDLIVR